MRPDDERAAGDQRARAARYGAGSLKDLPPGWRARAFDAADGHFVLRPRFRAS